MWPETPEASRVAGGISVPLPGQDQELTVGTKSSFLRDVGKGQRAHGAGERTQTWETDTLGF
jgi:hypothetical protein